MCEEVLIPLFTYRKDGYADINNVVGTISYIKKTVTGANDPMIPIYKEQIERIRLSGKKIINIGEYDVAELSKLLQVVDDILEKPNLENVDKWNSVHSMIMDEYNKKKKNSK